MAGCVETRLKGSQMGSYAIVGMSCLFPGASTPEEYWQNLLDGVDSRTEGGSPAFGHEPADREVDPEDPHRVYFTRGGFLGRYSFDPAGYRLPAEYLSGLDRVYHWSLHVARQALADAGLAETGTAGVGTGAGPGSDRVGVIFGNYPFPTPSSGLLAGDVWNSAVATGLAAAGFPRSGAGTGDGAGTGAHDLWVGGMPSRVVAASLGLAGPQFTLDAACSSALYAIRLACGYLDTGRADVMLAGGVCGPDPTVIHLSFSDLRAYPKDGFSQPFDARSKGIVTGQGASMVALKRLADAQRDGDRIYAVIESIGLTNDGAGKHVLAPNVTGQVAAYRTAYGEAGLAPSAVQYVECHATGTPLGDKTELAGVTEFFGADLPHYGSVKGNIGHLLTVAGMSSLIKVVLALSHRVVPPTIAVEQPLGDAAAAKLVRAATPWPEGAGGPRRAGVSAFGFGGTNAHVILGEAPQAQEAPKQAVAPPRLAITGVGAQYAAFATRDEVDRATYEGRHAFTDLPERRWRGFELDGDGPVGEPVPAGYVESFELDATAYRIPPKELEDFNQQHLLMLRVAEEALRDAGYDPPRAAGAQPPQRIGVVLAMEMEPAAHGHGTRYDLGRRVAQWCEDAGVAPSAEQLAELARAARTGIHDGVEVNEVLSYIGNIMASRISSRWNFTGPSFTVSADSGGAAYALEVAQLLLLDPTVDAVLVGAVDLAAGPENALARARIAAPGGTPGLAAGGTDGWRAGDGAGALVVTRPDAVPAGRTTYASVDAVAVRYGAPLVAPAAEADLVAAAATDALRAAGLSAADVELVETHGAGIAGQDAAELAGLARVWSRDGVGELRTALSSVAASVGDTQSASVLASVIRAALCLHHGYFPAAPDWQGPAAAHADTLAASSFFVPGESQPWLRGDKARPRAASVSALGTGGSHVHVVLSGATVRGEIAPADWEHAGGPLVVPVGGDDLPALVAAIGALRTAIDGETPLPALIRDAAADAAQRALRAVFVAPDAAALARQLDQGVKDLPGVHEAGGEWETPSGSYYTGRPIGPTGRVALVFPGAFNSYLGLGRELFRAFPALLPRFEEQADRPAHVLRASTVYPRSIAPLDRRELMRREAELVEDIPLMLASGTSFALLYTDLIRELMKVPVHGAFGYSLGESSMMFATDGWAQSARNDVKISATPLFRDQLCGPKHVVRRRWNIPDDVPDKDVWTTLVVLASAEAVKAALPRYDRVFLTHVNTPNEVVVAGDPKQAKALVAELDAKSARAPANHVMHCSVVDEELAGLADLNRYPTGDIGDLELFSSYDYGQVTELDSDVVAGHIAETLRSTVDFPRLIHEAYGRGYRYFIEVGPASTCARWVRETLGGAAHLSVSIDRRGAKVAVNIARVVARLVSHGAPVDLGPFLPAVPAERPRTAMPPRTVVVGGEPVVARVARGAAPIVPHLPPAPPPPTVAEEPPPAPRPLPLHPLPASVHASETDTRMPQPTMPSQQPEPAITAEREPITLVPALAVSTATAAATLAPAVVGTPLPVPIPDRSASTATALLHDLRDQLAQSHQQILAAQAGLRAELAALLATPAEAVVPPGAPTVTVQVPAKSKAPKPPGVIWDEDELLEFATGSIAAVFGEDFSVIDGYDRRVRLPAQPYHFVTRVTGLDATTGEFKKSFIQTEYDVPEGAWYSVDGQVPPAVTIEAGQCDLLLVSYLGIDFANKGERSYRLLDSTLSFYGDLPHEGQTLRYDIWIDQFVSHGETTLFFFHYDCYADGKLILKLKNACAGFFTQAELESSLGIIEGNLGKSIAAGEKKTFKPLVYTDKTSLTLPELRSLTEGRIAEVFGPQYDQQGANASLRLTGGKLLMVDEVTEIDRKGGSYGIGSIKAKKALVPGEWYFTCHFPDDPVVAGSLVAEGAVQLLQAYALSLGLQMSLPDARFQPVPELETNVKVRGQVTPDYSEIRYEIDITEVNLLPRPTIIADVLVYRDDKPAISVRNLGIQIVEKPGTPYRPGAKGVVEHYMGRRNTKGEVALLSEFHMAHAAKGNLATAMGPEFEIYENLRAPYIPNGDFQFVDRVMALVGERGKLKRGAVMETEYDSNDDAWYYPENGGDAGYPYMPNCVYMESSLQAAILLGYYLGATLNFPEQEFSIRNLDGHASLVKPIDLRGKTIRHRSVLLSSDAMPGAVLQNFSYELSADGEVFYVGESLFGYFSPQALVNQVGLDGGKFIAPWGDELPTKPADLTHVDLAEYRAGRGATEELKLGHGHLNLVEWVDVVPTGGKHGHGYLRGYRPIAETDWYFSNHFHRDPVMPGSLGVEAILQAMQLFVIETGLAKGRKNPRFAIATGVDTSWKYRGQINRTDKDMDFDVHVKEVRTEADRIVVIGDASLWKPGLRIYELGNIAIEVRFDA
jgi:PfaB family protein